MTMLKFFTKKKDILGLNERNFAYLKPYNFKAARSNADDKLKTKQLLAQVGLPVPKTYAIIKDRRTLYNFDFDVLPKSFVIKPNMGIGGAGIYIVFARKKNNNWVASNNQEVTKDNLLFHINDILEGFFSLSHSPDIAFFEQRLKTHPDLKLYCYKGVPDVRIIVFNRVPIMAMLRLPTKESKGKANLLVGGVGVGIDVSRGVTTHAVIKNKFFGERVIDYLPGTRIPLRGIKVPYWNKILEIAIEASKVSSLGYAGIDIAIDKEMGPVVLEVNARAGLSIQNANMSTLADRLRRVAGLKVKTAKKGKAIAKDLFGGEIEQELEEISGKQILGIIEKIKLYGPPKAESTKKKQHKEREIEVQAKIDTGARVTSIDKDLAIKLGFEDAVEYAEENGIFNKEIPKDAQESDYNGLIEKLIQHKDIVKAELIRSSHGATIRIMVEINIEIAKKKFLAKVNIMDRAHLQYPVIVGRRDLKKFLIDPTK